MQMGLGPFLRDAGCRGELSASFPREGGDFAGSGGLGMGFGLRVPMKWGGLVVVVGVFRYSRDGRAGC